jgi:hypothetical protein
MQRRRRPKSAAELRLRNAVETLANVFYLLENGSPNDIVTYVKAGRPALDVMIQHVEGRTRAVPEWKKARTGTDGN